MTPLLEVKELKTTFMTAAGLVRAVDGVSWDVKQGETVALVGESGCGKSVTALSIMQLVAPPTGRIDSGQILFKGRDLLTLPKKELRAVRGEEVAMIFQDPMTSLNPVLTIGEQIGEAITTHHSDVSDKEARARTVRLLEVVGVPYAERRVDQYPHEFSGGMRQRVMIAMALACNPKVLLADEPTTALDVTIQAQILDLLSRLQAELGMSIVLITHDLGVVAEFAREVVVMYAGRVVEQSSTEELFSNPQHPYTRGLLRSIPKLEDIDADERRLYAIRGMVPDLRQLPTGCRFEDRCDEAFDRCKTAVPELYEVAPGHRSRCYLCAPDRAATSPSEPAEAPVG